jgi:hypothetical protein
MEDRRASREETGTPRAHDENESPNLDLAADPDPA